MDILVLMDSVMAALKILLIREKVYFNIFSVLDINRIANNTWKSFVDFGERVKPKKILLYPKSIRKVKKTPGTILIIHIYFVTPLSVFETLFVSISHIFLLLLL